MTNKKQRITTALAGVTAMFVSMSVPVSAEAKPHHGIRRRRRVCSGPTSVRIGPLLTSNNGNGTTAKLGFWRLPTGSDKAKACGARVSVQFMDLEAKEGTNKDETNNEPVSFQTTTSSGNVVKSRVMYDANIIGARVTVSPSDLRVQACKKTFPFRLILQVDDGFNGNSTVFYEAWPCKWAKPGK